MMEKEGFLRETEELLRKINGIDDKVRELRDYIIDLWEEARKTK